MKRLAFIILILICIPVLAGQYEDALRTGNPVCLYVYTKTCRYCKQTNPVFEKMFQNHKKVCNFVRVDAESPYGSLLVRDLRINYVPFIALADSKRQYFVPISPTCALDYTCFEKELKEFVKR